MAARTGETVLVDSRVPFWRMVVVLFKLTLAAIPAAMLAWLVIAVLGALSRLTMRFVDAGVTGITGEARTRITD